MSEMIRRIVLPAELSEFERKYLARMNRMGLLFFAFHLPVFVLIAYFNDTGPGVAAALTIGVLIGPAIAYTTFDNPRWVSMTYGFAAMLMGGVLVHLGQGPVQIEMHFYFFALLAMLAVYGNPSVILVAAVTVALHHFVLWLWLPASVFNYDAPIWVVGVHALFVVLESVATCYIARSFFDNVIGLERIVQTRTLALDARNQDMRVVLDHVDQGLLIVDRQGVMSVERSAIMNAWFGEVNAGTKFASFLGRRAPIEAEMFELAYEDVLSGVLPLEVTLAQLPKGFEWGSRAFSLNYTPIMRAGEIERMLVVMTETTSQLERELLEAQQREMVRVFDHLMRDRVGFLEFLDEARQQVSVVQAAETADGAHLTRVIHTLKGNSTIYGIQTLADYCHELETSLLEDEAQVSRAKLAELPKRFEQLQKHVEAILGHEIPKRVELEMDEYNAAMRAVLNNEPRTSLAKRMQDWTLEPTSRRLERIAEQARRIAERLNKSPLQVVVRDNGLRLDASKWSSFWSSFVHVIRNAVDHGIEPLDERSRKGKSDPPTLELATYQRDGAFTIEIRDNGRGLAWSSIASRAKSLGLAHQTKEDLIAAIFEDGLSTAQVVNDFSGRGVGMGALRGECERRGGTMDVSSDDGKGTCVSFRFPEAAMTAEQRDAA